MLAVWVRVRRNGKYSEWMKLAEGKIDISLQDRANNYIRDSTQADDLWSFWIGPAKETPYREKK